MLDVNQARAARAELILQRWEAVALQDDDPEPPEEWCAQHASLIDDLIVPGRAQRNRGRTIVRRERRVAPKQPTKRKRREGAGAPRADGRRMALLTLALVYEELTGDVPMVFKAKPAKSKGEPTDFERFASERFDAIGLKMPSIPTADFRWWFQRAPRNRFNKPAWRSLLWGDIPAFCEAIRRNRAVRKAQSAIREALRLHEETKRNDAFERASAKLSKAIESALQAERDKVSHQLMEREAAERSAHPDVYALRAALLREERELRTEILRRLDFGGDYQELLVSLERLREKKAGAKIRIRSL
jgi:hypothetical protein